MPTRRAGRGASRRGRRYRRGRPSRRPGWSGGRCAASYALLWYHDPVVPIHRRPPESPEGGSDDGVPLPDAAGRADSTTVSGAFEVPDPVEPASAPVADSV